MAYETPLTIAEVMKDITNNKYVLPSIQREYVWDTTQIETLFDSIMQDYPIGAFLFWEIGKNNIGDYDFYEFLKNYHEKNSVHNRKADLKGMDSITAVLDGQQRLTSLYIGLKGTYAYRMKYKQKNDDNAYPTRKLYLNLLSSPNESSSKYEFKFLSKDEIINTKDKFWFEVGKILDMNKIGEVSKFINKNISFSKEFPYTEEQADFAIDTLSQLYNVINDALSLSYYKEKAKELDKVLNIFIRVNSGGTVLTYSDLLLSIASAQWENYDAREEITEFVDDINSIGGGFKINKDFVLKTALVLSNLDIAFKVDNFNKANMMKIEANWDKIKKSIKQSYLMIDSFGYTGETLTSNNAIIPISYYLMKIGNSDNFIKSSNAIDNKAKIKKWLILSLLKRAFSGQPDNVLGPIRKIIQNSDGDFPLDKINDYFKGTNKSIQFNEDDIEEYLLKLKYGSKETLSTLMLLYPSLDFSNKFHEDHIYPKSKFKKAYLKKIGIPENKVEAYINSVNDISNLQLLASQINVEKSNTDFNIWFEKQYSSDDEKIQYRSIHYMPEMDYTYNDFLDFTDKRRELLKQQLQQMLL